jgi:plasmid stabilization system protein ParE
MIMKYDIIVSNDAETDILEIIDWYEAQKEDLGDQFLLSFDEVISFLEKNPYLYQKIRKEIRRAIVQKYPYAVFYKIYEQAKEVSIIAVIHQARSNEYIEKRISLE